LISGQFVRFGHILGLSPHQGQYASFLARLAKEIEKKLGFIMFESSLVRFSLVWYVIILVGPATKEEIRKESIQIGFF
jgi:hypothetical protein